MTRAFSLTFKRKMVERLTVKNAGDIEYETCLLVCHGFKGMKGR